MTPARRAMARAEIIVRSAAYLERHGVDSPRANAEALLMHLLRTDRAALYARRDGLDEATARMFGRALCQRCHGTPLQHLTGEQQFFDLVLEVEPGVFVPRPETEVVVEAALERLQGAHRPVVLDIGTGTGAVALGLKRFRPDALILATDVSPAAVTLAERNARRLSLEIDVRLGSLFDPVPGALERRLDLVASNPPYVTRAEYESLPREVRAEPYEALVGRENLFERLVEAASAWLAPGGWLVTEIGAAQGGDVGKLFEGAGFCQVGVLPDLAGRDRVVVGRRPPGETGNRAR
jgi:release factor glutamine methyltransferase